MTLNTAENSKSAFALRILLFAGPVLLYLGATAFGVSEVHFSTDTWIGLAAGRQILTSDEFPKTDTFSYTFNGQVWYNQNWLTHLIQYWLYAYAAPNAVVYGTWALSASVFLLVMLATYWRSGSWFAALLAAGVVGVGCREFLSALLGQRAWQLHLRLRRPGSLCRTLVRATHHPAALRPTVDPAVGAAGADDLRSNL